MATSEYAALDQTFLRDNDTVEIEVTVIDATPRAILIASEDDYDCECPIWVPRKKLRVVQGRIRKNEIVTIHLKEDFAIEQGLSY